MGGGSELRELGSLVGAGGVALPPLPFLVAFNQVLGAEPDCGGEEKRDERLDNPEPHAHLENCDPRHQKPAEVEEELK